MKYLILAIFFLVGSESSFALPKDFLFHLKKVEKKFRWEKHNKNSFKGRLGTLRLLKYYSLNKEYKKCVTQSQKIKTHFKSIYVWLVANEFECAFGLVKKERSYLSLKSLISEVQRNSKKLFVPPYENQIRIHYINALLIIFKGEIKVNRKSAWKNFSLLENNLSHMDLSQKAEMYRLAGDLSFVQQRLYLAHHFYLRSAQVEPSSAISQKIKTIESKFLTVDRSNKKTNIITGDKDLEVTKEELKIYHRMKEALQTGDLTSAVEDGVKLIEKYPGGVRAEWAYERIYEILLKVIMAKKSEFHLIKLSLREYLKKSDGNRLLGWAKRLYYKGYYQEAAILSSLSYKKLKGLPKSEKSLWVMSRSYFYLGKYDEALEAFQELFESFGGKESSQESLLWMGLVNFRQKNYSTSTAFFEKLLAMELSGSMKSELRMNSMYWLWRSQQQLKSNRIYEEAYKLMQEFPLTYYGLKARDFLVKNKSKISSKEMKKQIYLWKDVKDPNISVRVWWTDREQRVWKRVSLLIQTGWFEEAQKELPHLMHPQTPKEKLLYSHFWSLAFNHYESVRWANMALNEDPSLLTQATIKSIFPVEYMSLVKKEAKKRKVSSAFILGLIKQESSFRKSAESRSRALGLMQLIRMTAFEVKEDLKIKRFKFPESLKEPAINIKMGTFYYSKMRRAMYGHHGMALAAYNAGIGNIRRWSKTRGLKVVKKKEFSVKTLYEMDPNDEIWIDELPWSETRNYVKSVYRNFIMYSFLYP